MKPQQRAKLLKGFDLFILMRTVLTPFIAHQFSVGVRQKASTVLFSHFSLISVNYHLCSPFTLANLYNTQTQNSVSSPLPVVDYRNLENVKP